MTLLFALLVLGQSHPLDAWFQAEWKRQELKPAGPADDAAFLRRVTLDLTGTLPEPDDVRAFLKSTKKTKRAAKIDELLASPPAAEYFAHLWIQWLMGHDIAPGDLNDGLVGLIRRLKGAWEKDTPYNDLVRGLLAPDSPFIRKHYEDPPAALAGQTARLFLGVDLRCAQCHDHPFQKISQRDFWGFAAFFGKSTGPLRDDLGELRVEPRFLDGRTGALADLMLDGDAAQKAIVDRFWTLLFGRKAKPELREFLVREFKGSLRGFVRMLATSAAYQTSSEGPDAARREYAAGPLKMMNSVQFMKAWNHAFQFDAYYRAVYEKDPAKAPFFQNPELFWVGQTMAAKELLFPKGRDPEEAMASGTDRLALKLMNNRDLQLLMIAKFSQTGQYGLVWKVIKQSADPARRLDELFLLMLSRPPTSSERGWMLRHLKEAANPFNATSDVFWTLFNSSEFIFIG